MESFKNRQEDMHSNCVQRFIAHHKRVSTAQHERRCKLLVLAEFVKKSLGKRRKGLGLTVLITVGL